MKISRCCGSLATCASLALLVPAMLVGQEAKVQTSPIVIHSSHTTTPLAFRDMADVGWHNVSKLMIEHDRAPYRHISNQPDTVAQTEVLPPVSTTSGFNFDGIVDSQGGGYVPPDTNASVGDTQVVETVNIAYAVWDKTTGAQTMAPKSIQTWYTRVAADGRRSRCGGDQTPGRAALAPKSIQTLYTPLGGECATGNLSDPVVNF